ncbi:hypothetical protein [Parvibaculum sp.]|uniref:hypothetical protein n=1 Tax=Parvibaculum sp. TaxID=2024848 RepID=UPI0025CC2A55|nr:hypothetical protein [Parvibaculum sp.]
MMRKFLMAALAAISFPGAAFADAGSSAQGSHALSQAMGDSVAKGAAISAIGVALPVLSVAGTGIAVAGPLAIGGSMTLYERTKTRQPLTVTDKTIVTGPSPDRALKARHEEGER